MGPGDKGKAQLYRALLNKGGRNIANLEKHSNFNEVTDSGKNYQLMSKPRGKQFTGTKVTMYFL